MAVNRDDLVKVLTDAGVAVPEGATIPQLMGLMAERLAGSTATPEMVSYDVIQAVDVSADDTEDIKQPGSVVSLDSNDTTVKEWLAAGFIAPHVEAAPVQAAAPAAATVASAETDSNTAGIQAIIDQQNEEQKVKEMFDLSTREGRWHKFLYDARKVNPARFDRQFQAGEFDTIPPTFEAPELEKAVGSPMGKPSA